MELRPSPVSASIVEQLPLITSTAGYYTVRASNDTTCLARGAAGGTETSSVFLGSSKAQTIFIAVWVCFGALLFIFAIWWCIRSRCISRRTTSDSEDINAGLLDSTEETTEGRASLETVPGIGGFTYYCRSLLSRGSSIARRSMLQTPGPPPGSPPTTIYSMPPPDYDSLSLITLASPVAATNGPNEAYGHWIPRDVEKL